MYARRRHAYFAMMGICIALFVLAWGVVRIWSVPAAVGMCVVAMVIPPCAAIVANRRGPEDRWWDDPPPSSRPRSTGGTPTNREDPHGDPKSGQWWDELDGKTRRRR